MRRKRLIAVITVIVAIILTGTGLYVKNAVNTQVREIFKLNEELKLEGYYMAEFEFKMLGCAYYLDKGQYITAFSRINQIHKQLKSREGLIKEPKFANKKEKLEFYLSRQNPKTGAFMDDNYPLFAYIGGTLNVISYIELLSQEVGEPLRLKYPLKFLDEINTPEKLKAFLDDLSTVGRIGANFRSPYVEAAELAASIYYPGDMERLGLYNFSPEWKKALLQWFYDNQDSKTGYWGPKLRSSGELLNSGDLVATEKIIKLFADRQGNNRHPEFPFRYKDEIFASTLHRLSGPMPEDLDELHEWTLVMNRGTRLLTRYLWSGASPENKDSARKLMEKILISKFENFYIEGEGGFSLYPGAEHADLDGTGETLGFLDVIGALSAEKQNFLWGPPDKNLNDLGVSEVSELKESDFTSIKNSQGVNSIRLYRTEPRPGNYTANIVCIYYPKETPVLDIIDLLPKVTRWVNATSQNMGNWVTKEDILQHQLANIKTQPVPVANGDAPLKLANEALLNNRMLVIIGFDVLQTPKYKSTLIWR
ncbi:MAG TPA: hypothetical protein DEF36_16635 [Desulfotomaculum sp.]|nr:hypothetical protein [Desulfotomaculum sp.]